MMCEHYITYLGTTQIRPEWGLRSESDLPIRGLDLVLVEFLMGTDLYESVGITKDGIQASHLSLARQVAGLYSSEDLMLYLLGVNF